MSSDLVWTMNWLVTLSDRLRAEGNQYLVEEFVADLRERETVSAALRSAAQEAGV
jgi:hypothetical protein